MSSSKGDLPVCQTSSACFLGKLESLGGRSLAEIRETSLRPACYLPSKTLQTRANKTGEGKEAHPFLKDWGFLRICPGLTPISLHFSFLHSPFLALHSCKNHIHIQSFKNYLYICRCLGESWSLPSPYSPRQRSTQLIMASCKSRQNHRYLGSWLGFPLHRAILQHQLVSHSLTHCWHYLPGDRLRSPG